MVKTHVYSKQVVLWSTSSAQWHEKLAMRVPAHRKPKGSESDLPGPIKGRSSGTADPQIILSGHGTTWNHGHHRRKGSVRRHAPSRQVILRGLPIITPPSCGDHLVFTFLLRFESCCGRKCSHPGCAFAALRAHGSKHAPHDRTTSM